MTELSYETYGDGPETIVLVHGYTGSADDFAPVIEGLIDRRRVVAVDQPGHGKSPRLASYDLDTLSAALTGFLESEMEEPVDVLGHSLGGRVAIPIAADRPELIRSLILMDTFADAPDASQYQQILEAIFSLPDDQILATLDAASAARDNPEERLVAAARGADWVERHTVYNRASVDPTARLQLGRILYLGPPSSMAAARRIRQPTTILVGANDEPFLAPSQRLVDAIPGARFVTIAGAYHSPQLTHPGEWLEVVRRHLEQVGG